MSLEQAAVAEVPNNLRHAAGGASAEHHDLLH
jgi:hypothetical protein